MKTRNILLLPLLLAFFSFSCKKNQLGGKSTISGTVSHHSKIIPYATVFIKYNAKEFPGKDTTVYDAKVRADAAGKYSLKCYKGDYYLYGYGYDYDIQPPYTVVGGVPAHIRQRENLTINVAVTEP